MDRDFDEVIDRRKTNSLKYDFAVERGMPEDILPMWVADMDFRVPQAVAEALNKVSSFGIYGYSEGTESYFQALSDWFQVNYDWNIKEEWLVKTPGIVFGIAIAIRTLTEPGEAVMIQPPVYYPFKNMVIRNDRQLVESPLVENNGHYEMDLKDFEEKIVKHNVKAFILCSPHNPVGRVWTEAELMAVGKICLQHGVYIISDEIHADFVYTGYQHMVFADLSKELAEITITCTSPSKTFNLAGLQISNFFIVNPDIKRKFVAETLKLGYDQVGLMGLVACETAYREGGQWLKELKEYLEGNLNFVRRYLTANLPEIKLIEPQGTYLLWLDFRELQLSEAEKKDLIVKQAGLWLDAGSMFGKEGRGFERINIACPRSVLERAMNQLYQALVQIRK